MSLQNLLIDAGVGFAQGLVIGTNDKIGEKKDLLDVAREGYLHEKNSPPQLVKSVEALRGTLGLMRWAPSVAVSSLYSVAANIMSHGELGATYVAVPAAVLGRYVGAGLNYLAHRKERRESVRFVQSLQSEKGIESFFTEEQTRKFNELTDALEDSLALAETKPEEVLGKYTEGLQELFGNYKQPKLGLILNWAQERSKTAITRGKIQGKVRGFFETNLPDKEAVSAGLMGLPLNPRARVYSREGSFMHVETAEWKDIKFDNLEERGIAMDVPQPTLTTISMSDFMRDYKTIAREIEATPDAVILLNSGLEIMDDVKRMVLGTLFVPHYGLSLLKQRMEAEQKK